MILKIYIKYIREKLALNFGRSYMRILPKSNFRYLSIFKRKTHGIESWSIAFPIESLKSSDTNSGKESQITIIRKFSVQGTAETAE